MSQLTIFITYKHVFFTQMDYLASYCHSELAIIGPLYSNCRMSYFFMVTKYPTLKYGLFSVQKYDHQLNFNQTLKLTRITQRISNQCIQSKFVQGQNIPLSLRNY